MCSSSLDDEIQDKVWYGFVDVVLQKKVIFVTLPSRIIFTQAPADVWASIVVCSTPGMGGDVLRSSYFSWPHGAPFVFVMERRPPSEVSTVLNSGPRTGISILLLPAAAMDL